MVAERSCVGCLSKRPKAGLVRIVRLADGQVLVDGHSRLPGRGAYVCLDRRCWQAGIQKRRLDRTLRATLTAQSRTGLLEQLEAHAGGTEDNREHKGEATSCLPLRGAALTLPSPAVAGEARLENAQARRPRILGLKG